MKSQHLIMLAKFYSKLNLIKRCHKDNKGSTVVTVLVAFMFISVLVVMTLATVSVNYRMRATDRKAKDEFYYAEKALNDIYAGLGENCALALGEAYSNTMAGYKEVSGSYPDGIKAYNDFCEQFIKMIYNDSASSEYGLAISKLNNSTPTQALKDELKDNLQSYIVGTKATVVSVGEVQRCNADREVISIDETKPEEYPNIRYTIIKDVKVETNDSDGVISGVSADIVIETPQIDFFTMNENSLDYALAAGQGIEFNGDATINGSVYGGARSTESINELIKDDDTNKYVYKHLGNLMTKTSDYGGIYVHGSNVKITGEKVVSGGDIYIDSNASNGGHLVIEHPKKNEIWFDNLYITGDKSYTSLTGGTPQEDNDVYIEGDAYAQGDLQVDRDNTNVKIIGNYYGYNHGTFATKADALTDDKDGKVTPNPSNKFSAVIMNGLSSMLDMSDIDNLVVLGKAFINHTKGAKDVDNKPAATPSEPNNAVVLSDGEPNDTSLGESVALKYGQELFLVPTEFLKGSSNPTVYKQEGFEFELNETEMKEWFGWNYLDHNTGGVSGEIPEIQTVKLESNGVYRAYCYLKFETEAKQREFVDYIVNYDDTKAADIAKKGTVEPFPLTMQKRHKDLLMTQNSDVIVGNTQTKVQSTGAVVEYKTENGNVIVDTVPNKNGIERFENTEYSGGMHRKYEYICTYLDSMKNKPITSLTNDVNEEDLKNKKSEFPFSKLFWSWGIRKKVGVNSHIISPVIAGSQVLIVRAGGGDSFYESTSLLDLTAIWNDAGSPQNVFIIVDGSAKITGNMDINGFIYVKDELIVEDTAKLKVTYDSTLLDRRIEAELLQLEKDYNAKCEEENPSTKEDKTKLLNELYEGDSLIYYILNIPTKTDGSEHKPLGSDVNNTYSENGNKYIGNVRKYKISTDTRALPEVYDVTADYTQFMYFENWKKGLSN